MNDDPRWFHGQVVLVVGGGHGIGRAYCLGAARAGARVVVNDLGGEPTGGGGSREAADAVVAEIRAGGGEAAASYESVASRAGGEAIVRRALDAFGRVDAVIVNAGILSNNRFEEMTLDELDRVLAVNLAGGFHVAQPAFRAMRGQGYGRFVFTGSGSGLFGHGWMANYAMAKAGVVGLSHVIAIEGAPHGIRSNVIMPSGASRFAPHMGDGFRELPEFAASMARVDFSSERRRGDPAYNAGLALFLASDRCPSTRGIFSAIRGRYAEVFVGVGRGWHATGETPPSIEDIAAHWEEICARDGFSEPQDVYDEFFIAESQRTSA